MDLKYGAERIQRGVVKGLSPDVGEDLFRRLAGDAGLIKKSGPEPAFFHGSCHVRVKRTDDDWSGLDSDRNSPRLGDFCPYQDAGPHTFPCAKFFRQRLDVPQPVLQRDGDPVGLKIRSEWS